MSITLARVATEFLKRPAIGPATLRSYESTLMPFLKEYGRWPIDLISKQILESYIDRLSSLSVRTRHRHRSILQALFNFAVEQDYLSSNPLPRIQQPSTEQKALVRSFSPVQMVTLYRLVASDLRMHALVCLLHRSGASVTEILAVDLMDVDRVNHRFEVAGRGNKRRLCFYSPDASVVLERYITLERYSDCSALFTAQQYFSKQVSRLSYRTVHKNWTDLIKSEPTLKGMRIYDLHNTFLKEQMEIMKDEDI
ncbi:MAG: phage integrase SAM-like domain-containing protein [Gloeobacterales cyanobacterium]